MSSLANSRVSLRSNNTLLVQKSSSSLHTNFNLTLYIIYELDYGCVILAIILHLPFLFCFVWYSQINEKHNHKYDFF